MAFELALPNWAYSTELAPSSWRTHSHNAPTQAAAYPRRRHRGGVKTTPILEMAPNGSVARAMHLGSRSSQRKTRPVPSEKSTAGATSPPSAPVSAWKVDHH